MGTQAAGYCVGLEQKLRRAIGEQLRTECSSSDQLGAASTAGPLVPYRQPNHDLEATEGCK